MVASREKICHSFPDKCLHNAVMRELEKQISICVVSKQIYIPLKNMRADPVLISGENLITDKMFTCYFRLSAASAPEFFFIVT